MSKFKWGPTFFRLNEILFSQYEVCSNSSEICEIQRLEMETIEAEKRNRKFALDYPVDYFESENLNRRSIVSSDSTSSDTADETGSMVAPTSFVTHPKDYLQSSTETSADEQENAASNSRCSTYSSDSCSN